MSSLLEVRDLRVGYGDLDILTNVSIEVDRGELITVVGPNGAGKSTLIKTVSGFLTPRSGTISFNGEDITRTPAELMRRHGIAYVPQVGNVFPTLTVEDNLEVAHPPETRSKGPRDYDEIFSLFPALKARSKTLAGSLSGGERQMLALSMGLLSKPELFLLDEPSAGLSPAAVKTIFDFIVEINNRGMTILMVEQNASASLNISNRGYVFDTGQVAYEGPGDKILNDPNIAELYLGKNV